MSEQSASRLWVEAWRGEQMESRHEVLCAAAPAARGAAAPFDPELLPHTFLRSAAKPLQLVPLVCAGGAERFALGPADLAILSASHAGTPRHAMRVAAILERLELTPARLLCGMHRPYYLSSLPANSPEQSAPVGVLQHNCSGNHAGMLALAQLCGDPLERYLEPRSVGQMRIHQVVEALCGATPQLTVDDCGSPCYGMPLGAMAEAYTFLSRPEAVHRLAAPRRALLERVAPLETVEMALRRIASAMATEPEWVSAENSGATRLAHAVPGELVVKHGAEGIVCVAHRGRGSALALKVTDGNPRALLPALLHHISALGWLDAASRAGLADLAQPELRGYSGQVVGTLRVAVPQLRPA